MAIPSLHQRLNAARPERTLSLRWKIPLLNTAVLALGLAVMLVVTYATITRRAELLVRDRLTHAVAEVTRTVRPAMAPLERSLRDAAADPRVRASILSRPVRIADRDAVTALLEGLLPQRDPNARLEIWDERGRIVNSVGHRLAADQRPARPPRSASSDSVWFGPITNAGIRGRFWVAAPVVEAGRRVGWVAMLRAVGGPEEATRMLREFTREELSLYVRNRDNTGWVSAPNVPAIAPVSRDSGQRGVIHHRDGAGEMLVAESPIEGTPWMMTVEVPLASVLARPRRTIRLLMQLSLGLLIAGAVFSWWMGRAITRPIAALTRAATELAQGAFPASLPASGDEIGRLSASFDAMARQVDAARRGLEQRAEEAQKAREAAEEANRAKTKFLSAMSHELRTPLNAIGGYAQLLEMGLHGPVTEEQRAVLRRIERSQGHLRVLIEDLLEFAQLEAGRMRFARERVELAETVSELEGIVEPQAAARRVHVGFPEPTPGVHAHADRAKVRQVALNLVVNAIKFTPEGGHVAVDYHADHDRVRLRVRDNGMGIPSEDLERIFEPFVQGRPADEGAGSGVGLGLAISRELARGMGGEVTVDSAPGVGSTFTLTLPRAISASGD